MGWLLQLTGHVGYEKGDPAGRVLPNARNDSSAKTVHTEVGPVGLDVPRDRDGSFVPRLVPKGQRRVGGLDDMIMSLYAGGMTLRDIQFHLASTIGTQVSHETISKIVDEICEEVLTWQHRVLEPLYPVMYLDALVVKVKDGGHTRNKAAHIAVGVDMAGVKHVLSIWIQANEAASFWASACADLGKNNPTVVRVFDRAWEQFVPFLSFPLEVRRVIYTTNSIESLNYQMRKIIKNRGQFPNDAAVVKLLWLAICNIEDKRAMERVKKQHHNSCGKTSKRLVEGKVVTNWKKHSNNSCWSIQTVSSPTYKHNKHNKHKINQADLHKKLDTL